MKLKVIDFILKNRVIKFIIPITRFPQIKHGYANGYCAVGVRNKLYGISYDELYEIDVHGGLTYSELGLNGAPIETENMWIFGFDTLHFQDTLYTCSESYVRAEVERLKTQLENYER